MPVLSTISAETDEDGFIRSEKFKTERGFELELTPGPSGLWEVIPHGGGKPPLICNERYTSYLRAREELIRYIDSTDRMGYAEHPDKTEKIKVKKVLDLG